MYIVTPLRVSIRSKLSHGAVVFGLGRTGSHIVGIRPTIKSTQKYQNRHFLKILYVEGGIKNDNFERFHELPWSNEKNSEKNA